MDLTEKIFMNAESNKIYFFTSNDDISTISMVEYKIE